MTHEAGPSTQSVHLTSRPDPATGAIAPPVVESSAFAYPDLDTWRAAALKQTEGHIYSRNSNPTTCLLEGKVAALEGAESATSFATGMAAISTTLFALLSPGQRAISVRDAHGATYLHFTHILPRFGIQCQVCATEDHAAVEAAIAQGCDVLYLESPTNPVLKILDLARLAQAAHRVGAVTSHVECTAEEMAAAGIPSGLVRYAVGIEDVEDLKADLERALAAL